MGEIGYDETAFLYELQWWQIRSIIRGYRRRDRTSWLQTRWQTWCILSSLGAKIDSPEQLLPLPFDHQQTQAERDQDEAALQELIAQCRQENLKKQQQQEPSSALQPEPYLAPKTTQNGNNR